MRLRRFMQNRRLYTIFLLSITLCIVLTLTTSSYIYYRNYSHIALKQAFQSDLSSLSRTSKEVVGMRDSAQALSFQIYRNNTISTLLYYREPNIYDVTAAMSELSNYLNSMPFIESVLVYNSEADLFYIAAHSGQNGIFAKHELDDTGILNILEHFKDYKPFTPIPRTYSIDSGKSQTISAYTYLCYDAINKNQIIKSAVIVNISASWINKDIAADEEKAQAGDVFILDDQNRILTAESLLTPVWTEHEQTLIRQKAAERASGYLIDPFQGKRSLISVTEPDSLGWQYIRVTPYSAITSQIGTVRNTTMTIAAVILLVGIGISWLLSGFLYVPIRKILNKVHNLETESRNNSPMIRQNALRSLLLGTRALTSDLKMSNLRASGIAFNFQHNYRVVLVKIDRFLELKEKRGADLPLYKYAIMNISSELVGASHPVETVDMDDDSVAILISLPEAEEPEAEAEFRGLLRQVQQAVLDHLSISTSFTYSPVTNLPLHLHPLYEQVKEASLHRMFYGRGCLIDSERILALRSKEYVYPSEKEKRLIEAVMVGRMEEAREWFTEIMLETSHYPIQVIRLAVSHLTMTMNNLVFTLQKNGALESGGGPGVYMPSLDAVETVEELTWSFYSFFDEVQSKLGEKRSMKQGDLVRSVKELIGKHYADPNLCLNWLADRLDMSAIHVSRVYKQQTGHAIIDVINNLRLEKAKELLEASDHSVAEIAEKTGYTSSSYFHRMFKKSFGVTPAEYRKAWSVRSS